MSDPSLRVEPLLNNSSPKDAQVVGGRAPEFTEFMPLSLLPLERANHDPGEHQVIDADTAYIFQIHAGRERAENIVECLNAYPTLRVSHEANEAKIAALAKDLTRAIELLGYANKHIEDEGYAEFSYDGGTDYVGFGMDCENVIDSARTTLSSLKEGK